MSVAKGKTGYGTTLTFGTSGFTADLYDVTPPGASREAIDVSHMESSLAMEFIPADLVDWGSAVFNVHFDPGEFPPIEEAAETITITFKDGETWAFSGFCTNYEPKAPLADKMTADLTIKVASRPVVTP